MSLIRSVTRLAQQNIRQSSTSAAKEEVHEGYKRLHVVQAKFQKNDGLPVHLKGGASDKILYGFTWVLCFAGIGTMGKLFYELAYKQN